MEPPSDSPIFPTLCDSLSTCSCHGFSSLQSPSAFPSFSSDDSSQQIEALLAEKRSSLLHCASFDVKQSSLSETWVASHEDILPDGGLFYDRILASMQPHNSELPPSPFGQDSLPASTGTSHSWSHSSSPDLSSMFLTGGSDGVCFKDSYGFPIQTSKDCNSVALETHVEINQNPCFDAHQAHEAHVHLNQTPQVDLLDQFGHERQVQIDQNPQVNPHDVSVNDVCSSVLKSFKRTAFNAVNTTHNSAQYADCIQVALQAENRVARLYHSLASYSSGFLESECEKKTKQQPLQDKNECGEVTFSIFKEAVTSSKSIASKALKENLVPQSLKQEHGKGGGLKADIAGWMCPRDAKKNFKPKPRQVLLDKWLIRQR